MPPLVGLKSSFAGGEFAPSLYSRTDLAKYSTGARKLRNLIVHPHGGISNRPGLKYIATEKTAGKKIRLIPFEFSTTQTYVLEFGDYYCRFFTNGAAINDDASFDSYTKLVMHNNASPFTDEIGKTISNGTVNDSFTKLLLHCNGTDGSTTFTDEIGKAITANGNAQIDTSQSKFGGASGQFDGVDDYLTTPDHDDWNLGANDFTIDFWARFNSAGSNMQIIGHQDQSVSNQAWTIMWRSTGVLNFEWTTNGSTTKTRGATWTPTLATWYHIAIVRSGATLYIFIDGVSQSISGDSIGADIIYNSTDVLAIAARHNGASYDADYDGRLDEIRVSNGIARWTANFTVPAVAYGTAVALDTSVKKFGAGSALFYGSGGYLYTADHADWNFGTGDFTIDFWVNFTSLTLKQGFIGQYQDSSNYWILGKNADNTLYMIFRYGGSQVAYYVTTAAPSFSAGTWYHLEFVRNNSNAYIFVDGTSQNLTTITSFGSGDAGDITSALNMGYDALNEAFLTGNIDELRVSKGVARHTANFTAPASAYVPGIVYEIVTPYAEADLAELNYTQSADILYLSHPDYAPRQLERVANTDWDLNLYDYTNGPFQIPNIDTAKTLAISNVAIGTGRTLTAVGFTFSSLHVSSLWKLRHYKEGQAVTTALASVTATSSIACGGTWRLITHGTWTATIRIEKSTDGGSNWTMLREFSSVDDFNANTFGTEDMSDNAEPFLIRVNMTARTSGTCNVNLTSDPFYQEGICKVTAVAVGGATATVDVKRTFAATTATIDWSEGSWSDYRGWPAVVEFHPEDRLVWANCINEPQTYWMTQTGDYTDFAKGDPLVDSDSISSPLPSRKVNGINGLVPLSEMIALTLSNEVSIRSNSGPLTPTSAYNKVQGYEGSYGVRPIVIGNRVIYVQSTGSVLRDLGFDLTEDSFKGSDLTIFSNHLFTGYTITEMAYQQNPDRLVWAIRSDGKLLSMTYMREQEVVAWSWHDTNEGTDLFESVCVIRGSGYDEVWFSVNRNGTRYIERMVNRMVSTAPEDQFFVDCGSTYDSTPATSITGLTQLASKAVAVLADGVVISGKTVSAGGVLTLDTAASVVQVGLAYKSDLETLNIDADLQDGSLQGRKVKPSRLVLRLLNTRGLSLGPDDSTLFTQSIGSASALFSGDHPATIGGGFRDGGRMFVRQSDPLPLTITGIMPEITIGGFTSV